MPGDGGRKRVRYDISKVRYMILRYIETFDTISNTTLTRFAAKLLGIELDHLCIVILLW